MGWIQARHIDALRSVGLTLVDVRYAGEFGSISQGPMPRWINPGRQIDKAAAAYKAYYHKYVHA